MSDVKIQVDDIRVKSGANACSHEKWFFIDSLVNVYRFISKFSQSI